jgi:hypothetical protein
MLAIHGSENYVISLTITPVVSDACLPSCFLSIIDQMRCPVFTPPDSFCRGGRSVVLSRLLWLCMGPRIAVWACESDAPTLAGRRPSQPSQSSGPTSSRRSHFSPHCAHSTPDDDPNVLCCLLLMARGRCSPVYVDRCTCWFTMMAVGCVPTGWSETQSDMAPPVQLFVPISDWLEPHENLTFCSCLSPRRADRPKRVIFKLIA